MGIIQIRRVQRANARLVVGLASVSGDGKTYTAIQLGYGLANYDANKLGLLDTENRRGSLYDDCLEKATRPTKERFWIADLHPPFTPARYTQAIHEFEQAGVEVLIIDSVTHEWEGIGGCNDIANAGNPKVPNWNKAKDEHKRFVNFLLQCDMHIIVCVRAREKVKLDRAGGKLEFVDQGLQPVQEKNFMFEMTSSLMLFDQGRRQEHLKVPDMLVNILGRREGYITADDGKALRDWNDGGLKLDPVVERFRNRLLSNTEGGVTHIEDCWGKTPEPVRQALGEEFHKTLIASAKGYDEMKADAEAAQAAEGRDPGPGTSTAANGAQTTAEGAETAAAIAAKAAANKDAPTGAEQKPTLQRAGTAPPTQTTTTAATTSTPAQTATPAKSTQAPASAITKKADTAPKQQELAPQVTGVLDSDPVF